MCCSLSFQLMKNFKVEYPEKEPFNVVQNVFLNADQKVPLKFTVPMCEQLLLLALMSTKCIYKDKCIIIIILLIIQYQCHDIVIIPVTSMTHFFTSAF